MRHKPTSSMELPLQAEAAPSSLCQEPFPGLLQDL